MAQNTPSNKKLADVGFPTIAAVLDGLLRLGNAQQAEDFLNKIAEHFVLSKTQIKTETQNPSIILWIRDYDLTPQEIERGYTGNFAAISYKKLGEKWTLYPTKIFVELKLHPHRKYTNTQTHPNWAHPIMKEIRKGKTYKTLEAAQADLAKIHEQFPTATIPTKECLYVMVFSRAENKDKPVQKYILEPKKKADGSFTIDVQQNRGQPMRKKKGGKQVAAPAVSKASHHPQQTPAPEPSAEASPPEETVETGSKFTNREEERRAKKRRKPSPGKSLDKVKPDGKFTATEKQRRAKKRR